MSLDKIKMRKIKLIGGETGKIFLDRFLYFCECCEVKLLSKELEVSFKKGLTKN